MPQSSGPQAAINRYQPLVSSLPFSKGRLWGRGSIHFPKAGNRRKSWGSQVICSLNIIPAHTQPPILDTPQRDSYILIWIHSKAVGSVSTIWRPNLERLSSDFPSKQAHTETWHLYDVRPSPTIHKHTQSVPIALCKRRRTPC